MTVLVLLSIMCGAVLAFRFKVLVLVPVILGAALLAVTIGSARGDSALVVLMSAAGVAVAVQCGYLGGLYTRGLIAANRAAARRRSVPERPQTV
jgi:hypothetical protein